MKRLLATVIIFCCISSACADGLLIEPFAGGVFYNFQADEEYMVVTYQTDTESGQCTIYSDDGNFEGEILLLYTFEESSLKVAVEKLNGRDYLSAYTTSVAVAQEVSDTPDLSDERTVSSLSDVELTPLVNGFQYQFRAGGYDTLVLKFRSATQKGSVTIYAGEDYYFEGEISLPYTYDDSYVVVTIAKTNDDVLYKESIHTDYTVPEPAEQTEGRLSGITVCIDPGHQETAQIVTEDIGPGLSGTKTTTLGMARGTVTERLESIVVLEIGFLLRDVLLSQGATVVMTREEQDVYLSNTERAAIAAEADADFFLRLHCNNRDSSSTQGIVIYCPYGSDYAKAIADEDEWTNMAEIMLCAMQEATGQTKGSTSLTNLYIGNNWAIMPSFLIEMGYMSNAEEDQLLSCSEYQQWLAEGMAEGIYLLAIERGLLAE